MIQLPTNSDIEAIEAYEGQNSLTLYSPYISPNSSENPNRTQFKNLLKEATFLLSERGLDDKKIHKLLQPAIKMLDDIEFRSAYKHSLVAFIGNDIFKYYSLPQDCMKDMSPTLYIGDSFDTKLIQRVISDNTPFYLLLLSHKRPRLYKGDDYKLQLVKKFPNMKQELNIDEVLKDLQLHVVAPVGDNRESERTHGHYNKTEVDKKLLHNFFQRINSRIHRIIQDDKAPLIIAGVDYLLPIYRKVNTYPGLIKSEIKANLEHSSIDRIQQKIKNVLPKEWRTI